MNQWPYVLFFFHVCIPLAFPLLEMSIKKKVLLFISAAAACLRFLNATPLLLQPESTLWSELNPGFAYAKKANRKPPSDQQTLVC